MTKKLALVAIAAIIETLSEVPEGEAPEGVIYIAMQHLGIDLEDYYRLVGVMTDSGLVDRISGPQLRITTKGRDTVAKMAAERKAKES